MTLIAAVTAAHPYWSGIGIWIGCSVIAAGLWALCKQRDDEDVDERRSPDGDGHLHRPACGSVKDAGVTGARDLTHNRAGSIPADAHTSTRPYMPPSFTKPAVKGFRRVS